MEKGGELSGGRGWGWEWRGRAAKKGRAGWGCVEMGDGKCERDGIGGKGVDGSREDVNKRQGGLLGKRAGVWGMVVMQEVEDGFVWGGLDYVTEREEVRDGFLEGLVECCLV